MKISIVATACMWWSMCLSVCQCFFYKSEPRRYTGSLTPEAPRVCNGQDVTFRCQLQDKALPDNALHFAMKVPPKEYGIVNETDIMREDNRSADFTLRSIPDVAFINVMCFYGQQDELYNEQLRIASPVLFPVYTMPVHVQNFQCIVDHYNVMVCSWDHGIEYAMDSKPKVAMQWRVSGFTNWQPCPNLGYESTVCRWERRTDGDTWLNQLDIRITLAQVCDVTVTSNFTLNTQLLVKPKPVIDLKGNVISSRCVQLQWNTPDVPAPNTIHDFRITKASIWNITYEVMKMDLEDRPLQTMLCDLEEDTLYTFIVKQKPIMEGFWSDGATIELTTLPDVPSFSPTLLDGGYYWNPDECTDGGITRIVCLLWRDIKKIDENGEMKGIGVNFTQTGRSEPETHGAFSEDTTYACARLLCNVAYTVSVKARNVMGMSAIASAILVQSWQPSIQQPTFTVEMVKNPIHKWSSVYVDFDPAHEDITDVYVSWCVKSKGKCANKGPVDWVRVSPNETNVQFVLDSPEKYLYSVSMVNNGVSYGSQWEHCIYTKLVAPTVAPHNVRVTTGPQDNTLVVTWDKLGCKSGEPLVVAYRLKYCHYNSGKCSMKEVPSSTSRLVLVDLVEDEEYTVEIQGVAQNLDGPYSPIVKGIPENNGLKVYEIIGISCGALAAVILAATGCVFTVRFFRKNTIKWKKKVGGVKLPEATTPEVLVDAPKTLPKLNIRRLSADSGVPPTPSPTVMDDSSIEWSEDTGNDHSTA